MRPNRLTLALAAAGVGLVPPAHAASGIEEIQITSRRIEETIPLDLARYGNQVNVITGEEIRQRGFIDVTQTLQMMVPGLHIRPKNGPFDYFDASLQGSRNQDILWLIDGVRITNRLYNSTSPLDTVPAHMIERIEVLKGGQGIYYGTQAVSGVINIVTKSFQQEADGAVSTSVNTNDGYGLNGYYRGSANRFQYVVYASKDQADGYQPYRDEDFQPSATDRDRGYDVNMGGVKLGFEPSENSLLSLHYQRSEADLDFASPMRNFKTVNSRKEDILTLKYDLQLNDQLGFFIKGYRHKWDTLYTRIANSLDADGNLTGELDVLNDGDYWGYQDDGINAMAKFTADHGLEYIAGYDLQKFSGYDEVWRIGDLEEKVNGYYLQVRTSQTLLPGTMIAVGVRRNEPSESVSSNVWNLSARHEFTPNLYVQTNIGTSFRLPDAEQLFLNEIYDEDNDGVPDFFFSMGNPNLKPEKSRNINLSVGGSAGRFTYELTGFRRRITDYIESYVPTVIAGVEGETFINTNDEVEIDGAELNLGVQLNEAISANLNYTDTSAELNNSGDQLVGIPESEIKLRVDYQPQAPYGLSLSLNHVGNLPERQGTLRGNYTVLDLSGHYELGSEGRHSLVLRIENLTDKEYATRVDVGTRDTGGTYLVDNLGMGRTLHASYAYRF
jgi:vitamin B12 transporter